MKITIPKEIEKLINIDAAKLESGCYRYQSVVDKTKGMSGLYCFWWKEEELSELDTNVIIKGPVVSKKDVVAEEEYIKTKTGKGETFHKLYKTNLKYESERRLIKTDWLPLYVGKSTNISNRLKGHIMSGTDSKSYFSFKEKDSDEKKEKLGFYKQPKQSSIIKKRNFSCQFRAGVEYLFRNAEIDTLHLIKKSGSILITHVEIEEKDTDTLNQNFGKRFYLEDLAIGLLCPPFNLDSER